jgi:hypothetical protein
MYLICIIQRSDATENVLTLLQCTIVIPISEVFKAKLLVSLMLGKLKCMGGCGLLWHDVHTEFHGNGLDVGKLLYAIVSCRR